MFDHIKGQNDVLWLSIVVRAGQRQQLLVSEFCGDGTGDLDHEFRLGHRNRYRKRRALERNRRDLGEIGTGKGDSAAIGFIQHGGIASDCALVFFERKFPF
jgi:hypothetical protein